MSEYYDFIWGVKSYDDLSSQECNIDTMNDIEIYFDKEKKKYFISFEAIYNFENGQEGEKEYIKKLFNMLTKWMTEKGYNTNPKISLYDFYELTYKNYKEGYDSIEGCINTLN